MARTCPAKGCTSPVASGKLMCRPCWLGLPKPLRDQVWYSWRAVLAAKYAPALTPEERLAIIRTYRDACAAAEAWWAE